MTEIEDAELLAHEAITARFITQEQAANLVAAVHTLAMMLRLRDATIAEADGPRKERLSLAELRVQLDTATSREERWRAELMRVGSERASASVAAFSDFCDGHKAGMKQALGTG